MAYDKFLEDEKVNGIGEKTLKQHKSVFGAADRFKSLSKKWTKQDVNDYVLSLEHKKSTIEKHKQILKKFFIWSDNKKAIEHLQVRNIENNLRREDILSIEDINQLIEKTPSTLYKAIIAFMFESGARISEILAVHVKDISESDRGMVISVPSTKTGNGSIEYRRDLYPFSSGYIRNHITYSALEKDDFLFDISYIAVHKYLQRLQKKAGLTKPLSCHKFRHARATDMVLRGYQESIIRKKLGWTGDSSMIAKYQHIVDSDVLDATYAMSGKEIKKPVITDLKQAESLKIADASMQLSKLNEENQELKNRLERLESLISSTGKPGRLDSITFEKGGREITMRGTINKEMSESEELELKKDLEQIARDACRNAQDEPGRKIIGKV